MLVRFGPYRGRIDPEFDDDGGGGSGSAAR